MTTFEHAMLGVNGALACGLHRRYQWRIVAFAGLAAVTPDWDSLAIVGGMQMFDRLHRAWGHSLWSCLVVGMLIATLDYRFDLMGRGRAWLERLLRSEPQATDTPAANSWRRYNVWLVIGVLAALSHIAADLVYSGGAGLSDWELKLFWPFSDRGFVYPLVPWGDVGATLIFVGGMFAMLRWKTSSQAIAAMTLGCLIAYIAIRAAWR